MAACTTIGTAEQPQRDNARAARIRQNPCARMRFCSPSLPPSPCRVPLLVREAMTQTVMLA